MACYRRKKQDKKCVAYVISGYDVIEVSQMKVIGTEQEIEWIKEALRTTVRDVPFLHCVQELLRKTVNSTER